MGPSQDCKLNHKFNIDDTSRALLEGKFAVLAWSHDHPSLTRWSDTIRIIESLSQCGMLEEQKALQLIDAYKRFRTAGHRLQLHNQLAEVAVSEFVEERKMVVTHWHTLFGNG